MAVALLQTLIQEHINQGKELPRPGKRYRAIASPPLQSAQAELYRKFMACGVRKVELARRLGIAKTNVDRLFNLSRQSRLDQIDAAFRALGKVLAIEIRDAA